MAKTKVKSREEQLQEDWLKYFKNIQKENNFISILIEYYKNYTEPKILNFVNSYDLYYETIDIPENINDIPIIDLRWHLHSIIDNIYKLEEEANNKCEAELKEMVAHFNKHLESFNKLEKQSQELLPKYAQNRFESLALENFKGFSKENEISIKPITLIYGPNSYGKSSILQSLLLLNQTVKEGEDYRTISLLPNGNIVKLGTFRDFINNKDEKKELKIELSLPYNHYGYDKYGHHNYWINPFTIDKYYFSLYFSLKNGQIILPKIEVYIKRIDYSNINNPIEKDKELLCSFKLKQNKENFDYRHILYELNKNNKTEEHKKTSYFTLDNKNLENYPFEQFEQIIKDIIYVSSYRTQAERYYLPENNRRIYVGKNGEYTAEILGYDSKVKENVNYWLKEIAGYELSLKEDNNVTSVNLDDNKTDVKDINLLDLGSGIAQILPIITQTFKSENDMILIEEPEIHLHPKAQAELGEMFEKAIQNRGNTFIIETHSENLLLRLQKLIRHGYLSKDDVSVIYIDKNKEGSYSIPLEIDDEGDIVNIDKIPDGFFEEGFNELFDIKPDKE